MILIARLLAAFAWLLNLASLAGYFALRRAISSPSIRDNHLRLYIIRAYASERDGDGRLVRGSEADELWLMGRLFAAAREYGNAQVVIPVNHADPGLAKIRVLAAPYGALVRVLEAPPMPPGTASGQMFNHKLAWRAVEGEVGDEDIIIASDCDSDLTTSLLYQVVAAYADQAVGGVGSYMLYAPGVEWPARMYTAVVIGGIGLLALDSQLRGPSQMTGNLLSLRASVYRAFGGFDSYTRREQLVDDVATAQKVLSTGKRIALVGGIRVYNRYSSWRSWWQRWTRIMLGLKLAQPDKFYIYAAPTYGAQLVSILLLGYGVRSGRWGYAAPFAANWAINATYCALTGAWLDALLSPISSLPTLAAWSYVAFRKQTTVRWRGLSFALDGSSDEER